MDVDSLKKHLNGSKIKMNEHHYFSFFKSYFLLLNSSILRFGFKHVLKHTFNNACLLSYKVLCNFFHDKIKCE